MLTRRNFVLSSGAAIAFASPAYAAGFEITHSKTEWKKLLNSKQYAVLRDAGTERSGSSPLLKEARDGVYHCGGCDLGLYASATKFESGTGWPSFWKPLKNAVATKRDWSMVIPRTEVHCRRCGGHLGHVFNDGPKPTGKRHCLNGVALTFKAT